MSILLTGYEAKHGELNASKILIESLRDRPTKQLEPIYSQIHFAIMPLSSAQIKNTLLNLVQQHSIQYCVFTGQAPGRNKITLERIATNMKDFNVSDNDEAQPRGEFIEPDGPAAYWSNLPQQPKLIEQLNAADIPADFSNHAGNHLCNQILYHGLHYSATQQQSLSCGFVHIPVVPEQVMSYLPDKPFMSLDMLRQALSLILIELVARLPDSP